MTDKTMESAAGAAGGSQPSEQATTTGGQQSSSGDAALQQRLDELNKTVKGLSAELNTLKSGKDRSVNETKKELASMKASVGDIERLMKERGIGLGEAVNLIENSQEEDEFKSNVRELVQHLRGSGSLPVGNGAADASKAIAEAGLAPDDPMVIAAFSGKNFSSQTEAQLVALRLALQKATQRQPSEADAASAPSKPAPKGNLSQEGYKKDMLSAPKGSAGDAQRREIKKKYLENGVDIHNVDLS